MFENSVTKVHGGAERLKFGPIPQFGDLHVWIDIKASFGKHWVAQKDWYTFLVSNPVILSNKESATLVTHT